ncbi:Mechanosensitive channel MscK [Vibrio stylophorae]|uniref:Mechanosensitive channel MscK n=1 Tax=Vibrio stylophorae TaxID=659351 RepID=A0ABM8ZTU1_9VIBR|nr:Mechanosensitive channel MscK [Vibrio stylophorae]
MGGLINDASATTLPSQADIKTQLEKLNGQSPKDETLIGKYQTLQKQISQSDSLGAERDSYLDIIKQFPQQKTKLQSQIDNAATLAIFNPPKTENSGDLSLAIASLQASIAQWRTASSALSEKIKPLANERTTLPVTLAELDRKIEQAALVSSNNKEQIDSWLDLSQLNILKRERAVASAKLQSLDERTELLQLEQKLLEEKITIATPLLSQWQEKLTRAEQASAKTLIEEAQALIGESSGAEGENPHAQAIAKTVVQHVQELEQVLKSIEQTRLGVQNVDAERRSLSEDLQFMKTNLSWLKDSTSFGASIRTQLQRLPSHTTDKKIPNQTADAHIRKYELNQQLEALRTHAENQQTEHSKTALTAQQSLRSEKLNELSDKLLSQLIQEYDKLIVALGNLQVAQQQYSIEVTNARAFFREQQLWTRSNAPLWENLKTWDTAVWFGSETPLKNMKAQLDRHALPMLLTSLMIYSLLLWFIARRMNRWLLKLCDDYRKVFGHPLKDRFLNTINMLLVSCLRAICLPLWFTLTAAILFQIWPTIDTAELRVFLLSCATLLFAITFTAAITQAKGLLQLHLNWPSALCEALQKISLRLRWPTAVFLLIFFWVELMAGKQEADISRLLFLLLMCAMTWLYVTLLKHDRIPSILPRPLHQGVGLALVRTIIFGSFIAIIVMTLMGYFIAAWMLLMYQQLTIFVIFGMLFLYQLGERWLKLEHRQLNYQRLLARREELIAQQQEQAAEPPELAELREVMPEVEEQTLDSEQISEQSLTLLRGLTLIGLVIAILTLWSSALEMTSWLDKVVIWQVSETISGNTVSVDVTLLSLLYAAVSVVVTFVGIRNLPGILELLVLSKLELAPGTGYAVTTLLRYLILMAGVLTTFSILGFQWSRLQWLVAAFGVGLGFGLQEIFANFISGLILLFERPIRIGDIVTINDLSGTVSKIQTRATTIIDWDNKEIVVPNKAFITEKLINWSLSDSVTRIVLPIGVAYGSDVEKTEKLLSDIAHAHPLVLKDPAPAVFFLSFGASSLDFELRVYINSIDHRLYTLHMLNKSIDAAFAENGIEIAFPQMDVHLRDWPPKEDNQ